MEAPRPSGYASRPRALAEHAMTRRLLGLSLLALIAGCGRKGEPRLPPQPHEGRVTEPQNELSEETR